ncbi:MAG: hypothetical protein D6729_03960 [Deltaproteobacteria bacterium]|nr:MAG: hypothetical protein D6729_03960 [Deltaproteobacteria bacterium]
MHHEATTLLLRRPAPSGAPTQAHRMGAVPPAPEAAFTRAWRHRLPTVEASEAAWRHPAGMARLAALPEALAPACARIAEDLGAEFEVTAARLARRDLPLAGPAFSLLLDPDQRPARLRLDPHLVAALTAVLTGTETPPLAGRPDPLTAAVLGHGLLRVLAAAGRAGGLQPRLAAVEPPPAAVVLHLSVLLSGQPGSMQIGLATETAQWLLRRLEAVPLPRPAVEATLRGHLCLPTRVALRTLRALAPGDALCPHPDTRWTEAGPDGPALLRFSRRRALAGRLGPDGFRVLSTLEVPMSKCHRPSTDPVAEIPIDVEIVLARVSTRISELAGLVPGAVLPLEQRDPCVEIVVGDRCIATGELVDVEGRLGVRVLATTEGAAP